MDESVTRNFDLPTKPALKASDYLRMGVKLAPNKARNVMFSKDGQSSCAYGAMVLGMLGRAPANYEELLVVRYRLEILVSGSGLNVCSINNGCDYDNRLEIADMLAAKGL